MKYRRQRVKDRRGYSHLKEEALDRTMWRHRFGAGFEPNVRQNTEWKNKFWVCVCSLRYLSCIAHAPYHIDICGVSGCTIFPHILS